MSFLGSCWLHTVVAVCNVTQLYHRSAQQLMQDGVRVHTSHYKTVASVCLNLFFKVKRMDNTSQQYRLVHPYVLEPRIKKPKTKQANAIYTAIFALQNSSLRHVVRVFCVAPYGFVPTKPLSSHLPFASRIH